MSIKTKIGILYGGRSVEHKISIRSAQNIARYIDRNKFEVILIGIDTQGRWYFTPEVHGAMNQGDPVLLHLNPVAPVFTNHRTGEQVTLDVVFPVLHGTDGEDGSIQGLLKSMNIPFVGSGVLGSALSMDKLAAKQILNREGISTSRFRGYFYHEKDTISFDEIVADLGLPLMVKSAALGSSVGVSKVKSREDFDKAVDEAFRYDQTLIIEEFITGREIECAILGNREARASQPGEIEISKAYEFYTFEAKYVDPHASVLKIPAEMPAHQAETIRTLSLQAYKALRCEDFARVDLFLTPEGRVYVNEINTIPGFTNSSMYPKLWEHEGISYTELVSRLVEFAMQRHAEQERISIDFATGLE
jgi:D-alanine-D-alanine ligase